MSNSTDEILDQRVASSCTRLKSGYMLVVVERLELVAKAFEGQLGRGEGLRAVQRFKLVANAYER